MKEGCYINKSLSVLNHVIKNLSKNERIKFEKDYWAWKDAGSNPAFSKESSLMVKAFELC